MDEQPVAPDALQLGWIFDPFTEDGPRWVIKAHWRYHHRPVECEWHGDATMVSW